MDRTEPQIRRRRPISRAERNRARRARTRARLRRTLTVLAVLVVLMVSGIVGAVLLLGPTRTGASNAPRASAASPRRQQPAPARVATATPKPQPKPAPTVVPVVVEHEGAPEAVSEAALPYPDAPSVTPRSFAKLNPKHRYIAITLDDGLPFDERILELLEKNDVRCTTFLLGSVAKSHPEIVERLHKDGFEIANHTWDHAWLTRDSESEIRSQLRRTQRAISTVTGNQAPYLRPPYGATDSRVKEIAAEEGYRIVMWSRSFGDTGKHATPSNCYKRAIEGIEPGDIVLCHWGRPATYEAMKWFLRDLKKRNLTPVTISELVADSEGSDTQ